MPADTSQTERIRRLKGQILAASTPILPTDNATWLSAKLGKMPYTRQTGTGLTVEESCCEQSVSNRVSLLILFGGQGTNNLLNESWLWDGSSWYESPSSPPPALTPRAYVAMGRGDGVVVMFGGVDDNTPLNETWLWDGSIWSAGPDASGGALVPRISAGVAYDGTQFVLFGGLEQTIGVFLNDTWLWTPGQSSWRLDTTPPPTDLSGRVAFAMASDGTRIVMFGGFNGTVFFNDTWIWSGSSWSKNPNQGTIPGRTGASMAYDGTQFVLFGGVSESGYTNETWLWDGSGGTSWVLYTGTQPPGLTPRALSSMAYDGSKIVLFSGEDTSSGYLNDTWIWENGAWSPGPIAPVELSGRAFTGLA